MDHNYNNYAIIFKALSDENRLVILDNLKRGECCACKLLEQLQISQPTLSHHMRILSENDLVKVRKDGKWMYYSLNADKYKELEELMKSFTVEGTNMTNELSC